MTITIEENETLEHALRRFKKAVDKESIVKECRERQYFEKESTKRHRKEKTAQHNLKKKNKKD